MKHLIIKLFITLFAVAFLCSCSDSGKEEEKTLPLRTYIGKYNLEKSHITINGREHMLPSEPALYPDLENSGKLRLVFSFLYTRELKVQPILHNDYLTFEYEWEDELPTYIVSYKLNGMCKDGEMNLDITRQYSPTSGTFKGMLSDNMAVEVDLSSDDYLYNYDFGKHFYNTVEWNGETYQVKEFQKIAFKYAFDFIRKELNANRVGFRMDKECKMTVYIKETKDAQPQILPGEYWYCREYGGFYTDEAGVKALCKRLFGSDEIIDNFAIKTRDNQYRVYGCIEDYSVIIEGEPIYQHPFIFIPGYLSSAHDRTGVASVQFWKDYFEKVGEEEGALAMQKLLEASEPGFPVLLHGELVK